MCCKWAKYPISLAVWLNYLGQETQLLSVDTRFCTRKAQRFPQEPVLSGNVGTPQEQPTQTKIEEIHWMKPNLPQNMCMYIHMYYCIPDPANFNIWNVRCPWVGQLKQGLQVIEFPQVAASMNLILKCPQMPILSQVSTGVVNIRRENCNRRCKLKLLPSNSIIAWINPHWWITRGVCITCLFIKCG